MLEQETERAPAPGTAPDEQIVQRVVAGETELFEILMRRNNARVYRAVRSVLRDDVEAEDAMQQAYLSAFTHLARFEGSSSFSTWLVRIAVNEALGRLRGRARLVPLEAIPEEREEAAARSPEDHAAAREVMTLLEKAIDRLPVHHRTVYVLREVEQLTTAEVAAILDVGEGAVKVRLHRARLALRDLVAAEVGASAPEAFAFLAPRCDRVVAAVMAELSRRDGA